MTRATADFTGKTGLIMGLGIHGGGTGAAKFFARAGADVLVTDLKTEREIGVSLRNLRSSQGRIAYALGRHRINDFRHADLVVKNPGVRPDSPYLRAARSAGVPITSEMGIFFRYSPATIIGVTGTRGKSTTATLIAKFLKTKYSRVFLAGNIRSSVLDLLQRLKTGDIVVIEISSFQLQDMKDEARTDVEAASAFRGKPAVSVITNIMRDHLNWHGSLSSYRAAKQTIFSFQDSSGFLFIPARDAAVRKLARDARSRVTLCAPPNSAFAALVEKRLGSHYVPSVAIAAAVARHFGIKPPAITRVLGAFDGLEGRQENIGLIRGIRFINDTTATIPDATIAALNRFYVRARRGARLILIAGGTDKNLRFSAMADAVKTMADAVFLLPGDATEHLKKSLGKTAKPIRDAESMRDTVRSAFMMARRGDTILLSPGAASFGLFANEFDRGEQFVKEVKKLKSWTNPSSIPL